MHKFDSGYLLDALKKSFHQPTDVYQDHTRFSVNSYAVINVVDPGCPRTPCPMREQYCGTNHPLKVETSSLTICNNYTTPILVNTSM